MSPQPIISPTAHEWKGNSYHCETCGHSLHCAYCGDGANGNQGHLVGDEEGWYTLCQDPERWERQRAALFERMNKAARRMQR